MATNIRTSFKSRFKRLSAVFVDFDETITVVDTLEPILFHSDVSNIPAPVKRSRIVLWESLVNQYSQEIQRWRIDKFSSIPKQLRETSIEVKKFHLQELGNSMAEFEEVAVRRVSDSGVFQGVTRSSIQNTASSSDLIRPGACEVFQLCAEMGINPSVVSVNWSYDLVRTCLEGFPHGVITCNDFVYDQNGVCVDGKIDNTHCNALTKLDMLMHSQSECGMNMYIGDSLTDLPALVHADIGVVIGVNKELREACLTFGVQLEPISMFEIISASGVGGDMTNSVFLYEAVNWQEVGVLLQLIAAAQCEDS